MIKTITFATIIIGIAFTACKKDRTCECTTTNSYTSTNSNGITTTNSQIEETTTTVYKKVTKKDISYLCRDSKYVTSNNDNNLGSNSFSSTRETKCTIK